jgi:hypothetical protein
VARYVTSRVDDPLQSYRQTIDQVVQCSVDAISTHLSFSRIWLDAHSSHLQPLLHILRTVMPMRRQVRMRVV